MIWRGSRVSTGMLERVSKRVIQRTIWQAICSSHLPEGGAVMHATLSPQTRSVCGTTASRTEPKPQLSDEQWDLIADMFPEYVPTRAGGRPPRPARECLEGIRWILRTGARWKNLPNCFPSPATGDGRWIDISTNGANFEYFRKLTPTALIGYSMYVYHIDDAGESVANSD